MSDIDPTAPLRADNNPKFYSRFKWLGLGAIAFGLWFVYDGYVTYPPQRDHSYALVNLVKKNVTEEEFAPLHPHGHEKQETFDKLLEFTKERPELVSQWEELATEKGWPTELPETIRSDEDIQMQFIMVIPCAIAAAWLLLTVYFANGRWIELRDGQMFTSWGQTFPISSITKIDKRQWRDKGIARVKYEHEGRKGKFVVDDYKFHRKTTDEILLRIEQEVGAEKISGGPPEAPPEINDESVHHKEDQTVLDTP